VYEVGGKGKHIGIRPCRSRKPMKTRLFVTDKEPEFAWNREENSIENWWEMYQKNNKHKIPLPGTSEYMTLAKKLGA